MLLGTGPSARPRRAIKLPRAHAALAALIGLILLAGPLTLGVAWSADIAAWLVLAATFTGVGAAIASREPGNAFGWVILAIGFTSAITVSISSADVPGALEWLRSWMVYVPIGLLPVALLLFPTGRVASPRWSPVLVFAIACACVPATLLAIAAIEHPDPLGFFGARNDASIEWLTTAVNLGARLAVLAMLLGVASLFARLRRASGLERRQVLCLFVGAIALLAALALDYLGVTGAWVVGAAALPVAAGIAILWHRLYDLDLFLSRSLVYSGLTVTLLTAFAAIVLLGNLVAASLLPEGAWTAVACGLVALGLDPVRRRLQRAVDRLLYGDRDRPYDIVTSLGRKLRASTDAEGMLLDVTEAVARGLALPYVAIELSSGAAGAPTVEWGRRFGEPVAVPLAHRGEQVGRLLVSPRTVGGRLSDRDERLLADLSHQVALTVKAVELSAGLQRAREHLVTAREEERRRLRRDLHDGLGPTLAAMVLQLDAASNVLRRDPARVEPLLGGLRTAAQEAVADIRRLVDGLRPPALDELGLRGAIQEWADRLTAGGANGLELSVRAPLDLPVLPAAVEVAALRIVQEAVTNVVRHANARSCCVRIAANGGLVVEIEDDGRGLPGDGSSGVGLGSMRERAAEVGGTCAVVSPAGGGVRIHAVLPIDAQ